MYRKTRRAISFNLLTFHIKTDQLIHPNYFSANYGKGYGLGFRVRVSVWLRLRYDIDDSKVTGVNREGKSRDPLPSRF